MITSRSKHDAECVRRKKQQHKTEQSLKLKQERRESSKKLTLLIKNLREISFSDLPEGAYSYISPDNLNVDTKIEKSTNTERDSRKQHHQLVQLANKKNREAKRNRKLQRRHDINTEDGIFFSEDMDFKESISRGEIFIFGKDVDANRKQLLQQSNYVYVSDQDVYYPKWYLDKMFKRSENIDSVDFQSRRGHYDTRYDFDISLKNESVHTFDFPERFSEDQNRKLKDAGFVECGNYWRNFERRNHFLKSRIVQDDIVHEGFSFSKYMDEFGDMLSKIPGFERYVDLADDLFNTLGLLYLLYRERSTTRRIVIFHLYLGSMQLHVKTKIVGTTLYVIADNIINNFMFSETSLIETESLSDHLSQLSFMLKSIASSSLVTSIRNLVVSVAALKFLEKDVAMQIFKYFGSAPQCSILELTTLIIDSLAAIFRVGEGLMSGLPLSDLLFTTDPITAAVAEGKRLISRKDMLYSGLPVKGKICQKEFVSRGEKVMPILERAIKCSNPLKSGYKAVSEVFSTLGPLIESVKLSIFGCDRIPPFCIVLHGDPGIGKSTLMNFIYRVHSDVKKRAFSTSQIFSRVNSSDYWEGYDPWSHPYIHYSELGNVSTSMVKTKGDPILSELTSVIDSVAFPVNMAFGDKGKVFFIGELIVIDTNNPNMNMDHLFANPAAFRRRFLFVKPTVLQELRKEDSSGIDINKGIDRRLCDKYSFNVYKEIEQSCKKSRTSYILKDANIDQLYDTLYEIFSQRIADEERHLQNKRSDVDVVYGNVNTDVDESDLEEDDDIFTQANEVNNVVSSTDNNSRDNNSYEDDPKYKFRYGFDKDDVGNFYDDFFNKDGSVCVESHSFRRLGPAIHSLIVFMLKIGMFVRNVFFIVMYCFNPVYRWIINIQAACYVAYLLCMEAFVQTRVGKFFTQMCWKDIKMRFIVWTYFFRNLTFLSYYCCTSFADWAMISVASYLRPYAGRETVKPYVNFCQFVALYLYLYFVPVTAWSVGVIMALLYASNQMIAVIGDDLQRRKVQQARERRDYHQTKIKQYLLSDISMLFVAPQHYAVYAFYALTAIGFVAIIKKMFFSGEWKPFTEDKTDFIVADESNEELNKFEEKLMSRLSIARTKGKSPEVWSVKTIRNDFSHTGDAISLATAIKSNVRLLLVNDKTWTTAVGICEDFLILNTHSLPKLDQFLIKVSMNGDRVAMGQFKHCTITPKYRLDLGNDITLLRVCQLQFKDIRRHLSDNGFSRTTGVIAGQKSLMKVVPHIVATNETHGPIHVENAIQYDFNGHQKGDCGLPIVVDFAGRSFVAAIHFAGMKDSTKAFGTPINLTKLTNGLDVLKSNTVLMPIVSQSDDVISLEEVKPKSAFLYENLHNVDLLGNDGNPILANNKSRLRKSILHEELPSLFFDQLGFIPTIEYAPPMMRPGYQDGQYVSPFNTNLIKINTEKKSLNRDYLEDCISHLVERVVKALKENGVNELSPLTFDEAINGANVDAYLRRVNASTGSGYGFKGKKDKFIPIVQENEEKVTREPTAELKKKLADRIKDFQESRSKGTIFGSKLKDEPRDINKVKKGKTRMFYPAPLDSLILARQVLAPIFTRMVEFNDIFMTSVGINMHMDGEKLYKKMSDFADNDDCIFDGDYGGFDTSMPYEIGLAASSVVYRIAEAMGYSKEALLELKGVLSDNLFPILEVLGDIFIAAGIMTSGSYGTAEFNCIRNVLMLMYYFRAHETLTLKDFDEQFFKTTYGDDVTGVVKKIIQDRFNNVLYANFCKNIYGMDFTTPNKEESKVPLRKLEEFSFLKRTFAKHPQFGNIKAVLDLDSVYKMLYWVLPSDSVTSIDQLSATCSAALWELFLRLGRDDFIRFRESLIALVRTKVGDVFDDQNLPTWERICHTLQPDAMELKEEEALDHSVSRNNAPIFLGDMSEGNLQW